MKFNKSHSWLVITEEALQQGNTALGLSLVDTGFYYVKKENQPGKYLGWFKQEPNWYPVDENPNLAK